MVVSVIELHSGRQGGWVQHVVRVAVMHRQFRVIADVNATEDDVLSSVKLPRLGVPVDDRHPHIICIALDPVQLPDWPGVWIVTATYQG